MTPLSTVEIQFTYNVPTTVKPPTLVENGTPRELPSQGTLTFPLIPDVDMKTYYDNLLKAIRQAKDVSGKELTAWRDAFGDVEKTKEAGLKKVVAEDDEVEEVEPDES